MGNIARVAVKGCKCVENTSQFSKYFIENHSEDTDQGYFLEDNDQYPEKLNDGEIKLPVLLERMKIEKVEKPAPNLYVEEEYVIHKRNWKQA